MIDLRSDTVTVPTPEMYEAICRAPLGDDAIGKGDDPTVHRLQDMAAERMGMEAALFVPSGMMANLLAVKLFAQPGDRVVCERRSHLHKTSLLTLTGTVPVVLQGDKFGVMDLSELAVALSPDYNGSMSLLCLENSFNGAGGTVLSVDYIGGAAALAHSRGVPVHLDGARIFNAAVAAGLDARDFTCHVDTVMFCISKGLSSPVGSLLVGRRELIEEARKLRSLHGGAMRQAGILAACGIVSLERMIDRLADDHSNARLLAEGLAEMPGVCIDLDLVQTNLIWFDIISPGMTAEWFADRLAQKGVVVLALGPTTVRLATHKDISREDVLQTLCIMRETLGEFTPRSVSI